MVVHVHHRIPHYLLTAWDRGHGPGLKPEDLAACFDWEEEAFRYGVSPDVSREGLVSLIEASTVELEGEEHRALHGTAGDFARWGRLGLETLRRYGRPWFVLLVRRRWKKIDAEALARYRAEQLASEARAA